MNGLPHGVGKHVNTDGDAFDGTFAEGQRSGEGKLVMATGRTFQGSWVNNMPHGQCVETTEDGDIYEGAFE